MPIPVTCQCGQSFAAGDHLAGRTVQCPKCQQPLTIPAAPVAANPSPFGAPAPGGANIFDQAGMRNFAPGRPTCPSCTADLPPNAVLCVKCGYHLQMGRKVGAQATAGPVHGDGHGHAAAETLARAAEEIDRVKEDDRKALKEGMPWWAIGGIFLLAVTFLIGMLLLPNDIALAGGGITIYVLCGIIYLYHYIRILMIAFTENIGQGLGCLFCGPWFLIYSIMHWDQCGANFLWMIISWLIGNVAGGTMIVVAPYAKPSDLPDGTYFFPSPVPVVRELTAAELNYPRPTLKLVSA